MYPYKIIGGLGLYELFIIVGIICAVAIFGHFSKKLGFSARLHNFILTDAVIMIIAGYLSAVLFQAFYNYRESGIFSLGLSTGATFLGGLIGGAVSFIAVYLIAGSFVFADSIHIAKFREAVDIISVCLTAAHGFGRLGCLMAGCCHGRISEYGLYHVELGARAVPVQLYEALFLFGLCALLWYRLERGMTGEFALYMLIYGVWRFFIEYFRDDSRGATVVDFLTPSQLVSVIMIFCGAVIFYTVVRKNEKKQ